MQSCFFRSLALMKRLDYVFSLFLAQVSHGAGSTLEGSHNNAAHNALRSLANNGLDNVANNSQDDPGPTGGYWGNCLYLGTWAEWTST